MVLLLAILLAVFVVPFPTAWTVVILLLGAAAEVGEIVWGRRLARRWRPKTGAEAMIGMSAEVVASCRPNGKVRVQGELWEARCEAGADRGDTVRIERLDALTLIVAPAAEPEH